MTASGPVTRLTAAILTVPEGTSDDVTRFLSIARVGMSLGAVFHFLFVLFFWANGMAFMAWYNVAVTLIFAGSAWAAFRDVRIGVITTIVVALVEMPLHGWLATWYTGLGTLFILHPLALATALVFIGFLGIRLRILFEAYLITCIAGTVLFSYSYPPIAPLDAFWGAFMGTGNAVMGAMALALISTVYATAVYRAEEQARAEHDRAEGLLRNILPEEIAERLKAAPDVIADEHTEATILFADIVNFTERSSRLKPAELVDRLNRVFSAFDALALKHGVEKIKTIGDAYMVVAGLPRARPDHAAVIVRMAQDMLAALDRINQGLNEPIRLRIGINTGPVVAGVIGQTKFAYDLWGDAVNVASRLEEIAEPGQVRIGEATRDALGADFPCTELDRAEVKGKGVLRTWALDVAAG